MFGLKKENQPPAPIWFKLGMLLLVIYAGSKAFKHSTEDTHTPLDIDQYPALTEVADKDRWQRIYNPGFNKTITQIQKEEGSGDVAVCGQEVRFVAELLHVSPDVDTPIIPQNPQSFTVGKGPMPWDRMIRGLKQGGTYQVEVGVRQFDDSLDMVSAPPHLFALQIDALQPYNDSVLPFRRTVLRKGSGAAAYCGDTILVTWRMLNAKGEELLVRTQEDEAQSLSIGRRDLGHGIDRGVLGMELFEVRRLEIPPAYQPENSEYPFPEDELVIVEIQRMAYKEQKSEVEHNASESDREPTVSRETLSDDGGDRQSGGAESSGP